MDDVAEGFRLGERFVRWGSTVVETLAAARELHSGDGDVRRFKVRSCYGFDVLHAQIAGARLERPVTGVSYELAAPRRRLPGAAVGAFNRLREMLGPPDQEQHDDTIGAGDSASRVVHWATWSRPPVTIGVSIYGGPRKEETGWSAGMLYLTWTDTQEAAARFVPAWTAECDALAQSAQSISRCTVYHVAWEIPRLATGYDEEPTPEMRAARLALDSAHVLITPPPIARKLAKTSFALWRPADGPWALSTKWDTIRLGEGFVSAVDYVVARPARGGGWSELYASPWAVRSEYRSADMAAAADAIEKIPGVALNRQEGADY